MKPAPFAYAAPETVSEALALLDVDSRPLAGGQSLVPMLNFRLARPARLVDLERVAGLDHVEVEGDVLRIGAMARQAAIERSPAVAARWPLLRQAVRLVGHPQIRARGTVGGSVAHADPKAELPVALAALGARFHLRSTTRARSLSAGELLRGPLMTALAPDELLVEIEVPAPPAGSGTGFAEHARTHGDFALGGAAALVADGEARLALLGAGPVPVRFDGAADGLVDAAVAGLSLTGPDADWRRALLRALACQALERAQA